MVSRDVPFYRRDLALVHHLGFRFQADLVAPGVLKLLEPVLEGKGLVVERTASVSVTMCDDDVRFADGAGHGLGPLSAQGLKPLRPARSRVPNHERDDRTVGRACHRRSHGAQAVPPALVAVMSCLHPLGIYFVHGGNFLPHPWTPYWSSLGNFLDCTVNDFASCVPPSLVGR